MSEKKYPSYNINVGAPTTFETTHKLTTYKFHPYGLGQFRNDVVDFVREKQKNGLNFKDEDQLTFAWRSPWDTHHRYRELFSPLVSLVEGLASQLSPNIGSMWFLRDLWVADYSNGSGANKHHHGTDSLGWSFCYYIKMPDIGPAFSIFDDNSTTMYDLNSSEGDLLFFRHPVEHQVLPATEERIIISGNFQDMTGFNDLVVQKLAFDIDFFKNNYTDRCIGEKLSLSEVDTENWEMPVLKQMTGLGIKGGY